MGHVKRFFCALMAFCLIGGQVGASDINPGYTFSVAEQNVTHTKLNNLVDAATINTTFFTDKSATTTPSGSDVFLIYSVGSAAFRKATLDTLFLSNTNLIVGKTEDTTPATNDLLLTWDVSAGGFKKTQIDSLLTNANIISTRQASNTPLPNSAFLLMQDSVSGAFFKVSKSNLLWNVLTTAPFSLTNLLTRSIPINDDQLLIWDSSTFANRKIKMAALVTNAVGASVATSGDQLLGYSTNDNLFGKFTMAQIRDFSTNAANSPWLAQSNRLPVSYIGTNGVPATGGAATFTHGLGVIPQHIRLSLVCTNADAATSYAAGDEVELSTALGGSQTSLSQYIASSTAVTVRFNSSATFQLLHKTSGSTTTVTSRDNFQVVCRATYFP